MYFEINKDGIVVSAGWTKDRTPGPNLTLVEGDSDLDINIGWKYESGSWADLRGYKEKRNYPPIGDQLDALFHAGVFPEEMAAKIQAVKDAYPKD